MVAVGVYKLKGSPPVKFQCCCQLAAVRYEKSFCCFLTKEHILSWTVAKYRLPSVFCWWGMRVFVKKSKVHGHHRDAEELSVMRKTEQINKQVRKRKLERGVQSQGLSQCCSRQCEQRIAGYVQFYDWL